MLKRIIIIVVLLGALAGALLIYFNPFSSRISGISPASAMPKTVGVFVNAQNMYQFIDKVDAVEFAENIQQATWFGEVRNNLSFLKSLSLLIDSAGKSSLDRDLYFGFSNAGSGRLGVLNVVSLEGKNKEINAEALYSTIKGAGIKLTTYTFDNSQLATIDKFKDAAPFTFTVYKNLWIGSFQASLVEESLLALKKGKSDNQALQSLLEKHSFDGDLNLFVNLKSISQYTPFFVNNSFVNQVNHLRNIGEWMGLEVHLTNDKVLFNGYTNFSATDSSLLNRFASAFPVERNVAEVLPNNTAYFNFFGVSDDAFFETEDLDLSYFHNWTDGQYAYFSLESFDDDFMKRSGLVVKAIDASLALENLKEWSGGLNDVDSFDSFKIYQLGKPEVVGRAFPHGLMNFQNVVFGVLNDYVIFAQEASVLKSCFQKYLQGNTLSRDLDFVDFSEHVSSRSNYFVYTNPSLWLKPLQSIFRDNVISPDMMQSFYWQFSNVNKAFFTSGAIHYGKKIVAKTNKLWELQLDTLPYLRPQIVVNHTNKAREIMVQDAANQLYLINASGEILFKVQLSGPIVSNIYQIDFYNNKKLQYVFNTTDKIFVVDRNGNSVGDFPLNLPAPASNGMAVVNYDKSNNYRFFVACENKKIYGYEFSGKPLQGWSPLGETATLTTLIRHHVLGDKDFITFCSDEGYFYALDRRGDKRFKEVAVQQQFSQPFVLHKDEYYNGAEGKVFKVSKSGALSSYTVAESSYHLFDLVKSPSGDMLYAFAGTGGWVLCKSEIEKTAAYSTSGKVTHMQQFEINKKLWFMLQADNMIYLVDELGTLHPDFPVQSMVPGTFARLYDGKEEVLILQTAEGKLQVMEIKFAN
jgi:hypothetical protein